jgi:leucyl/phenylalanyl-tRNA--protein transferase
MKEREYKIIDLNKSKFPDLRDLNDSGVIAFGGDLSVMRLLEAYKKGIFPWYDSSSPILWHSPLERCIFNINAFIPSHSLKQKIKKHTFTFTFDQYFKRTMQCCALIIREKEVPGTWILNETVEAYTELYNQGYAHSLEVWNNENIVGGLFGVSIGKAFFGESMFHILTDASKAALFFLFDFLKHNDFHFVDAQMPTDHLYSLGASLISRNEYLDKLENAIKYDTLRGNWNEYIGRNGHASEFYGRSH